MARNTNTEVELPDEPEVAEAPEVAAEGAEAPAKQSKKQPLPEGFVTPTALSHILSERYGEPVAPQRVYGYVKNGKDFPSQQAPDGRVMVPEAEAVAWVDASRERAKERAAKREAKAAADAAAASAAENTTEPTPEGE